MWHGGSSGGGVVVQVEMWRCGGFGDEDTVINHVVITYSINLFLILPISASFLAFGWEPVEHLLSCCKSKMSR